MRYLATFQDSEMASLKNSSSFPTLAPGAASRGRDNYSLFGVLRTKPGRADSPPTLCMSCSDKIASWNVTGFQGALASQFLEPVYVDTILIGDVETSLRDVVQEDCERAFWKRLDKLDGESSTANYHLCQLIGVQLPSYRMDIPGRNPKLTSPTCRSSILRLRLE